MYMALEPRIRGYYFVNSKHFANFAYNLMSKNGDDRLPNTIEEARESLESDNWEKSVKTELDFLSEKIHGS